MLSAIIVAYHTPAELAAAVASLHAQTEGPAEIIVVDNGAAEPDQNGGSGKPDGVRLELPAENLGFGAGCNLGASVASGNELLFMNADVVLAAGAAAALLKRLHSDERIAAVGPRVFSGGELQLSARSFPSLRTGLFGRRSILTRLMTRAQRYPAEFRYAQGDGGPVDWVTGACVVMRRSAFEDLGGFDEGYWMYWEDADLCRRLTDAGWKIHYEPKAVVHHATGASGTTERTIRAFHESAALFASRYIARTRFSRGLIERLLRFRCRLVLRRFGAIDHKTHT